MSFSVIIPARYEASRLPGKPLADICGKPMLQHTWEKASESKAEAVHIATDDRRIAEAAEKFGASVIITSSSHRSGTDRIQEAAALLALTDDHIVVNVQGDEPLLPPAVIDQVAANLQANPGMGIATLCERITTPGEIDNPNAVKVVLDKTGQALYFSRATIPHQGSVSAGNCHRHIGLYAYRVATLNAFVSWPPAELELTEKLEQLRALYNGVGIHVHITSQHIPAGVDTEQDLEAVRNFLSR